MVTGPDPASRLMRILILGTAFPRRVFSAADEVGRNFADAEVVFGVRETEAWRYGEFQGEVWSLGESRLPLDSPDVRDLIVKRRFDRIIIPLGLPPRQSMFYVVRYLRWAEGQEFSLDAAPFIKTTNRRLIQLLLVLYSLLVYGPLALMAGASRHLDGALLVLLQLVARPAKWLKPRKSNPLVCHVITSLGTGGAQRQLIAYAAAAPPSPVKLKIIALFGGNRLFKEALEDSSVSVELLEEQLRRNPLGSIFFTAFPHFAVATALWKRLHTLRPCCTYGWLFLANVVASPVARLCRVPRVLVSIRNMSQWKAWKKYRQWWYRPVDRLSAPLNDGIVGNARAVADDYQRWSGVRKVPLYVIPNAVDSAAFAEKGREDVRASLGLDSEMMVLLAVGRLAIEKDYPSLLRCSARLRELGHTFRLVIVGHGELEPELRLMAKELDIGDWVKFAGKTGRVQDYFRSADIFLLSSIIEGMPNVVIEAQMFGLPVVTTDAGGSAEVVVDRLTGYVVGVGDEAKFVDRVADLISDADRRKLMGRRGAERITEEFGTDRLVAGIDSLTREAVSC